MDARSYALHYNFCRIHKTLRVSPAMSTCVVDAAGREAGLTDRLWDVFDLIEAERPKPKHGPYKKTRQT